MSKVSRVIRYEAPTEALEAEIKAAGIKKKWLADRLEITPETLRCKIIGASRFTGHEIDIMRRDAGISDETAAKLLALLR